MPIVKRVAATATAMAGAGENEVVMRDDDVDSTKKKSCSSGVGDSDGNDRIDSASWSHVRNRSGDTITRIDQKMVAATEAVHTKIRPSLLSSETEVHNYRGLYTLGAIIIVVMNFRLVVDNIRKYGLEFDPSSINVRQKWPHAWPCMATILALPVFPLLAFVVEIAASNHFLASGVASVVHILISISVLVLSFFIINISFAGILPGATLALLGTIMSLKLCSYIHVRHVLRSGSSLQDVHFDKAPQGASKDTSGTNAVFIPPPSLSKLFYFMAAPTLCYQEVYPRSARIRIPFLIRRVVEMLFIGILIVFMCGQYVIPAVDRSMQHMDSGNVLLLIERILKIAIPNTLIWLLGFYFFFHSYLNFIAEILRFGDRLFYLDWWNAPTLGVYWRSWNLPVRHFVVRHIYRPSLRWGLSPMQAQLIVFAVSAAFHEVFFSVPTHMFRLWTFFGMMLQIPLIILTRIVYRRLGQPVYGNIVFWLVFVVFGQPLLLLLYGHAYTRNVMGIPQ